MNWKLIDSVWGSASLPRDTSIFLWAALYALDAEDELLRQIPSEWPNLSESSDWPLLQAAGREIIALPPSERLALIDCLFTRLGDRAHRETWYSRAASQKIAEFAKQGQSVRCAFGGALHPALLITDSGRDAGTRVHFVSREGDICLFARLCARLIEAQLEVSLADPLAREDSRPYDLELSFPPFGQRLNAGREINERTRRLLGDEDKTGRLTTEIAALADIETHATGEAILLLSEGTLFRAVGAEYVTRADVVASGRLAAVLSLPSGMLLKATSVESALIIMTAPGITNPKIRFVDLASDRFAEPGVRGRFEPRTEASWAGALQDPTSEDTGDVQEVERSVVLDNSAILTANRYLAQDAARSLNRLSEKHEALELAELVEIVRPLALQKASEGDYVILEAAPSDISERGFLDAPRRRSEVSRSGYLKAQNQFLRPSDVLLSIKGTIGAVGLVPEDVKRNATKEIWAAGQSFLILRPRPNGIAPITLYELLSSETMQQHLQSLAGGSAVQGLNMRDIRALKIPVPDSKTQTRIEENFYQRQALYDEISRLVEEIAALRDDCWPNNELGNRKKNYG